MHREPHREWLNSDRRHNMSDLGTFCQCGSVNVRTFAKSVQNKASAEGAR